MTPKLPQAQRPSAIRTFLIADIRGYTRFTNQLGDEAGSRLAAKFAQIVAEGIEAWGGELIEVRGDETLVTFESARQALQCAVELQDAFADETDAVPDLPIRVGIGLDAGEAVAVGEGYRGAALNLAARLCSAAGPGEVIATASLVHLAGRVEGLTYAELDGKPLKGFDEPIAALLVAASAPHEHDGELVAMPPTGPGPLPPELDAVVPLAGREADLRWLGWYWRRARHGHGGVVTISGPAGIGRTRLAAELASIAQADGAGVAYLRGVADVDAPQGPALVVIDDLDEAPSGQVRKLLPSLAPGWEHRLVVVTHREPAPPSLARQLNRLVPLEHRRSLAPLDADAVRTLAGLYVERPTDDLPVQLILEESDGIPAAAHRVASQWARSAATRRLGASAERTAAERRGLRAAESELLGDLSELEHARERTRIYVTDTEAEADAESADGVVVCPYKGLASFEAEDAEYFFGRERLIGELVAKLVGSSFLGLIGASGSGKSSVLKAGLLPALAAGVLPNSDRWVQVKMRPGDHPMHELRAALVRRLGPDAPEAPVATLAAALEALAPGQRLVLVVDQFEEVFGAVRNDEERRGFLDLVTTERSGLKVVVAMRADHYEHSAAYPELASLLGANQVLVGPLLTDEIRAIVEHPATRAGLRVEPELTNALVDDAGISASVLPLLSTTLVEVWQAREGRRLTLSGYRMTGGLRGAVARMAEGAYQRLDTGQQDVARALFLRLAGEGEHAVVRRRVPVAELEAADSPLTAQVLHVLTDARLIVAGEGHVELAHEAILREWPRYRGWLEEDQAGRQIRLHLATSSREWDERGRTPDDLYRGARLAAGLDWAEKHERHLNALESAFLDASAAEAQRETERQRRTNRRLRGLLGVATILLLAVGAAGAYALAQADEANRQADRALAAERSAQQEAESARNAESAAQDAENLARSRELGASALAVLDEDPALARLLALSATQVASPPIEVLSALHAAQAADRVIGRYEWPSEEAVANLWVDVDPNGRYVVASEEFGESAGPAYMEVRDLATDALVWSRRAPEGVVFSRAYFVDNGDAVIVGVLLNRPFSHVPVGPDELGLFVLNTADGSMRHHVDLGPCGGVAWGGPERAVVVWQMVEDAGSCYEAETERAERVAVAAVDAAAGTIVEIGDMGRFSGVAVSRDGTRAAFEEFGDEIRHVVVDVATTERILVLDPRDQPQLDQHVGGLNNDGSLLLYGDRPLVVFEVDSGERVATYSGHAGEVWHATFAPDGSSVFSAGRDGTVQHWRARGGLRLATYPGLSSGRPASSSAGLLLVADLSPARIAHIVETGRRGELGVIPTCESALVYAGTLTRASDLAVLTQECNGESVTIVVDLELGRVIARHAGANGQGLAIAPDGSAFVTQTEPERDWFGPPAIRDAITGEVRATLAGVCAWDARSPIVPDGQDGCAPYPSQPFPMYNWRTRWSPDLRHIVAFDGMAEGTIAWDAASGELVYTGAPGAGDGDGWFTPDGEFMITVSNDAVRRFSTGDWGVVDERAIRQGIIVGGWRNALIVGASEDEATLYVVGGYAGDGGGSLHWIDVETLSISHSIQGIHQGSPKAAALNPSASLIATGASDGVVRVWSAADRSLVHEFRIGTEQVQGLVFVDDYHLAVAPQSGHLIVYTVDGAELVEIVRGSLVRGFTDDECARFFPEGDCPTLEELRGDGS